MKKPLFLLIFSLFLITCDDYQDENFELSEVDSRICENISMPDSNSVIRDAYSFSHIIGLSENLPTDDWIIVSDSGEIVDAGQKKFRLKSNAWYGIPSLGFYTPLEDAQIMLNGSLYPYGDTSDVVNPGGNFITVLDSNWVIVPDQGWLLIMDDGTEQNYTTDYVAVMRADFIVKTITNVLDSLRTDTVQISNAMDTDKLLKINSGENFGYELLSIKQSNNFVLAFDKYINFNIRPVINSNVGDELSFDNEVTPELIADCQKYDPVKESLTPYVKTRLIYDLAQGEYLIFYTFEDVGDQLTSSNKSYHLVMMENN